MEQYEIENMAASLYDGGWRWADRNDLQEVYDLNNDDTDGVSRKLLEYQCDNEENKFLLEHDGDNYTWYAEITCNNGKVLQSRNCYHMYGAAQWLADCMDMMESYKYGVIILDYQPCSPAFPMATYRWKDAWFK